MRLRVLAIVGSARVESRTRVVVRKICELLSHAGADVRLWELGERGLPLMIPEERERADHGGDARLLEFHADAQAADAHVWGTPSYHDSYSGVLKNALDHLSTRETAGRPLALACHGGRRTTQPLAQLRVVARALGLYPTTVQVCTEESDFTLSPGAGEPLIAPDITARMKATAAELLTLARLLRRERNGLEARTAASPKGAAR